MGIIISIIMGLIIGLVAKWIMPGRDPGGVIITILIGIGGGFVGGQIANATGFGNANGLSIANFVFAVLGAVILLTGWRLIKNANN